MPWFFFAVLTALTYASTNTFDKLMLSRWIKNPVMPLLMGGIIGMVFSIVISLVFGLPSFSLFHTFLGLGAGFFSIFSTWFYFKALQVEEVSRVVPLYNLYPIFITIGAALFLGEVFPVSTYLGIALLVIGGVLVASRSIFELRTNKAFWFMMLVNLSFAVTILIRDYLLQFGDFWAVFSLYRTGAFLVLLPFLVLHRKELLETVKLRKGKVGLALIVSRLGSTVGTVFATIALFLGPSTLVGVTFLFSPVFVFLFALSFTFFLPRLLKEEITKKIVATKLLAIAIILVGAVLIL